MRYILTKPVIIMATVTVLLLATVGVAVSQTSSINVNPITVNGSWSKNGFTLSGSHTTDWGSGVYRSITGYSASSPYSIQTIYVYISMSDRCKNANGTWQTWHQYAYNSRQVNNVSNTGTILAGGYYYTCSTDHEYLNMSTHNFIHPYFSINESHSLYSS